MSSILVLGFSGSLAYAQDPPYDPAFDIQLFDQSVGPSSFMSINDGSTAKKNQYSVDFLLTFLTNPFLINNYDENTGEVAGPRTEVVSSVFAGQLVGAYGLTETLQLGVSLPLVFSISGDGLDPATGMASGSGLQATGFGDLRLEIKGNIINDPSLAVAWYGGISAPTSFGAGGNDYLGDDLPSVRLGSALHWQTGAFHLAGNLGVILRKPRQVYAVEIGQQLTYGLGSAYSFTQNFSAIAEVFGRSGLTQIDLGASPLEAIGGLRVHATDSVSITAGGGAGLVGGIGSPGLRFVLSLGYAPDLGDSDGDGIPNNRDRCPLLPEDKDQFEDSDGCPDNDNDGDKREDSVDQCPNDKEDLDGFEDEDGCPEADNDGDTILDVDDKCPDYAEDGKAPYPEDGCPGNRRDSDDDGVFDSTDQCPEDFEDKDGFEDWDGCPEPDNDRDGILDEDDACPICPEDIDGFEDKDGCPDVDNDFDGIADSADQCPNEAEVFNDSSDTDGCPDDGAAVAVLNGDRLAISSDVKFSSSNGLRDKRTMILIAKVMALHPDVSKWRIVVAGRNRGDAAATKAKSQAQADSVAKYLILGGIAAEKLEAIGASASAKTFAIVALERTPLSPETFICPDALETQERPSPVEK